MNSENAKNLYELEKQLKDIQTKNVQLVKSKAKDSKNMID